MKHVVKLKKKYYTADQIIRIASNYPNYAELVEALAKEPGADVVEVVRCRDCEYLYRTAKAPDEVIDHVCTYWDSDGLYLDDFCSMGKRRDET